MIAVGINEIEREAQLFRAIIDSSEDAIISKDIDGVITSWKKSAERLFGYTAAEAIGQSITILIPPDRLDEEPQILSRLRRGERVEHFEKIRRRKDGSLVDISLTISPMKDREGNVFGASKIARASQKASVSKPSCVALIMTWSSSRFRRAMTCKNPCAPSKSTASF
jgi:PAS domain S-box-containing protein